MSNIEHLEVYWQKQYNENVSSIKSYLKYPENQDDDYLAFHKLANWIVDRDVSYVDFLPENWQSSLCSADGLASLLSVIHHAMLDDGDITFVSLYDDGTLSDVFMVFYHRLEDNFIEYCKKALGYNWTLKVDMNLRFTTFFNKEPRDYVFVSYTDPARFIQEYTDLQKQKVERNKRLDKLCNE